MPVGEDMELLGRIVDYGPIGAPRETVRSAHPGALGRPLPIPVSKRWPQVRRWARRSGCARPGSVRLLEPEVHRAARVQAAFVAEDGASARTPSETDDGPGGPGLSAATLAAPPEGIGGPSQGRHHAPAAHPSSRPPPATPPRRHLNRRLGCAPVVPTRPAPPPALTATTRGGHAYTSVSQSRTPQLDRKARG